MTPEQYEASTGYKLPDGYAYVLDANGYVIIENGAPKLAKKAEDNTKKDDNNNQNNNKGGKNNPKYRQRNAPIPFDPIADKYRRIEGQRTRCRLRQGQQFEKLSFKNPAFTNYLPLYQRNHRIASSKSKKAYLEKRIKKR